MQETVMHAHKLNLKNKISQKSNKLGANRRLGLFCTQVLVLFRCKRISFPLFSAPVVQMPFKT